MVIVLVPWGTPRRALNDPSAPTATGRPSMVTSIRREASLIWPLIVATAPLAAIVAGTSITGGWVSLAAVSGC